MTTWLGMDAPGTTRPLDLRLLAPAVASWLTALVCPVLPPWISWVGAVVTGTAAVVVFVAARAPWEAAALCLAATLGATGTVAAVTGIHVYRIERSAAVEATEVARETEFTAVVRTDPRARAGMPRPGRAEWVITARTTGVQGRDGPSRAPVVLLVSGEGWDELLPGQRVRARGVFLPAEDSPLTAALVLVRGPPARVEDPSALQSFAGGVRTRLREAVQVLPQPERGLLPALVVGDVSGLSSETAEDFRATGMTHLLTVSGANLAVLTGFVLGVARLLRAPPWCSVVGGSLMIWVFVLVCRPEPSVVRAAFMGSLGLLALATGRTHAALGALSATVVGVLFVAPELAASYGFALSVLATAGIVLLVPPWTRMWSARIPPPAAEALAVAVAAQLAVSPVLVLLSGEVSWVAVPANVLAAPVVAVVTVVGSLVAALAALGALPVVAGSSVLSEAWAAMVTGLVHVPGVGVSWIVTVAEYGARVPYGALPWRPDVAGALALAALLALFVLSRGFFRRVLAAVVVTVLVLALALRCLPGEWPPRHWALVACDVGQGDAFVLAVKAGSAVVFDTGEHPKAVDECLHDLGVREIPLLLLSHDHADHVDGVPGVLRHRTVGAVMGPEGMADSAAGRLLVEAGIEMMIGVVGQELRVGPWYLRVLWPEAGFTGSVNDGSLVVRADGPLSVLLTGDIEEDAQQRLLRSPDADLLSVGVLTTPHHGAATQEPGFLATTEPHVTVTSAGEDNSYGHPAPSTWNTLERVGAVNLRTDRDGAVAVLPGGGSGPPHGVVRGPAFDRPSG